MVRLVIADVTMSSSKPSMISPPFLPCRGIGLVGVAPGKGILLLRIAQRVSNKQDLKRGDVMLKLSELTGLTAMDMGNIFGFIIALNTVSVFLGILLFWMLKTAFEMAAELLNVLCDLIGKKIAEKWHKRNR